MKAFLLLPFLLLLQGAVAQTNPTAAAITTTIKALYTNNAPLDVTKFTNANTYQSKALADTVKALAGSAAGALRLKEYFVLACFFRATNGIANPRTDLVSVLPKWSNTTNWITNANYCTWSGIVCTNVNNLVTDIVLFNNSLTGEMPDEVILLGTTLVQLDLGENFYLWKGNFTWMPKMTALQFLYFGGTSFDSDGIPTQISSLKNLRKLPTFLVWRCHVRV
jgi:hypothetical protein